MLGVERLPGPDGCGPPGPAAASPRGPCPLAGGRRREPVPGPPHPTRGECPGLETEPSFHRPSAEGWGHGTAADRRCHRHPSSDGKVNTHGASTAPETQRRSQGRTPRSGRPLAGAGVVPGGWGASFRAAECAWGVPGPSRGCAVRATPEGTPTLTTVLLTGLVGGAGWGPGMIPAESPRGVGEPSWRASGHGCRGRGARGQAGGRTSRPTAGMATSEPPARATCTLAWGTAAAWELPTRATRRVLLPTVSMRAGVQPAPGR